MIVPRQVTLPGNNSLLICWMCQVKCVLKLTLASGRYPLSGQLARSADRSLAAIPFDRKTVKIPRHNHIREHGLCFGQHIFFAVAP